jgi:hypothetical protein
MRYVNRQIYARETIKWFDQFTTLGKWNIERQQRVKALGDNPKPEDVDAIMGGPWTAVQCSECGEHRDSGIELDTCDTEDGKPVVLCLACLDKADGLFEENEVW